MHHVLFLCSGNYYRSRFAEALFNHHAVAESWPWRAFSRGLAIHLAWGDISPHAREALKDRGIDLAHTAPTRKKLTLADLAAADLVIALKEAEHRPLLRALFPDWEDRVEYWHVDDLDCATPEEALPGLEQQVEELGRRLTARPEVA
jgi:protein-tyrosine phosphatase